MTGDEGRVSVVFAKLPPKTPYWDQVLEVDFIRFGVGFFFFLSYYGADVYVMLKKKVICKYVFTILQISLGLLSVKYIHIRIYIYTVCLK